ncbi:MAG TPA: TlpA disulfide reductase family protein [Polyangia bacterium]|jgi:thiol-disulfide isomerase/thioredoxin
MRAIALGARRWPLALVAGLLAGGCATEGVGKAGGGGQGVGRPAPEIVVDRLNGNSLALSSLRGKVVLLDVWASWCAPCKQELPMLDAIAGRLHGHGVEVLAVSVDQERENVDKFLAARGRWHLTVAHDPKGAIADTFQPEKMPTSYIIDRAGIIRYVNSGFEPADAKEIEQRLADLAGAGGH